MDMEASITLQIVPRPGCRKLGFLVNEKRLPRTKSDPATETEHPETITKLLLLLPR